MHNRETVGVTFRRVLGELSSVTSLGPTLSAVTQYANTAYYRAKPSFGICLLFGIYFSHKSNSAACSQETTTVYQDRHGCFGVSKHPQDQ
jgi:hypothetical protein